MHEVILGMCFISVAANSNANWAEAREKRKIRTGPNIRALLKSKFISLI